MGLRAGYKQTEVGVVPEDWIVTKLGSHATFKTGPFGSALHKSDYVDGGIPVINPMQIVDGKIEPTQSMAITEQAARKLADFRLSSGNILIGRRGEMGRCAFVNENQQGWLCGTGSMIIRPSSALDGRFLQRMLSSPRVIAAIENASVGSTMINLNQGTLGNLILVLPPTKAEQEAIADALSDADALIESLEQLIAKERQLKRGAMQKFVTGKKRLSGFSDAWEVKRLGDIAEIRDGTHQTPKYVESGVPFLSVENVTRGDFSNTKFISEAEHRFLTKSFKIEKGDILMTRIGSIGDCKLIDWDIDASFYVSLALLKIRKGYSAAFICHYSESAYFKKEVELNSLQSAIPKKINLGPISNVRLEIPTDPDEQTAIAAILSDMDAEITALEAKLAKARYLKQGMMYNLLTGRIRLI
jgi:type I restriction enzyme, S subunit